MDITPYIPKEFQTKMPSLEISDAAIEVVAKVVPPEHAFSSLAYSACTFTDGIHFLDRWFRETPIHLAEVAKVTADGKDQYIVLAFDHHNRRLLSPDEANLPEEYHAQRLIAETRAEWFPKLWTKKNT